MCFEFDCNPLQIRKSDQETLKMKISATVITNRSKMGPEFETPDKLLVLQPILISNCEMRFFSLRIFFQNYTSVLIFASEVLKSLVRHERNQQLMCEAGMVHELLIVGEAALANDNHPLNPCIQYILERLAAQSLRPRELR